MLRPLLLLLILTTTTGLAAPVRIFFDTDMDTDCDDAGAMAVLHVLADRGECEILATVASVSYPASVPVIAAINAYYGRPNLPTGGIPSGGVSIKSPFADAVAKEFPGPFKSTAEAPDALTIYRDVLEAQPDGSVTLVTVGYLTNLRRLLELPAENGRPTGAELIRRKVKHYVCMGGNFIGSPAKDDLKLGNVNFQRDAASAFHVIHQWPTPLTFAGREVCSVPSGLAIGTCLKNTPANNPVRRAYEHYFGGKLKNRHVADLVTVLYAVRGARDYWDVETRGSIDLQRDMTFEWRSERDRDQAYLLKKRNAAGQPNDREIEKVLEELVVQPPRSGARPPEK